LFKELSESYKSVLTVLKAAATVKAASDSVLLNYERPADQSDTVKTKRASYGQTYYDKYAGTTTTQVGNGGTTMKDLQARQKYVNLAISYFGCKESDGSHKKIIDLYNSHKPLARGYAVKYTDAWCATYVSAMAIGAGLTDIIPLECSCAKYIELAKKAGIWVENDAYVPTVGDIILYDWQDGTNYATTDNTGEPDHIGIVVSVSGSTIKVIEGNISDSVGYRSLQINGRYIRGFVTPKYSSKATTASTTTVAARSSVTAKTYTVKKGDSLWSIAAKQLGNGSRYKEIKTLNGLVSDTIHAGQVLKLPN
jgi:LysM repeat protein